MSRTGRRSAALLLALCLLLGLLAGCGKKGNTQQLSATVYVPKYLDLDLDVYYIQGGCTDGENLYIIGENEAEHEQKDPVTGDSYIYYTYTYDIYRVSLEDGAVEKLPGYQGPSIPEGLDGNAYIQDITAAADGTLWVREYTYIWGDMSARYPVTADDVAVDYAMVETAAAEPEDEPEEPESEDVDAGIDIGDAAPGDYEDAVSEYKETIVRRHLDAQGNELECIDISNLQETLEDKLEEGEYVNSISFDNDGNIYAVTSSRIYVLDPRMNTLFAVDGTDMWYDLFSLGNNTMGMQKWDYDEVSETSTHKLLTIDLEKQDWGPEYILPSNVYQFYPGSGDYLCYYQGNNAVFGWKGIQDSGADPDNAVVEGERLFSWVEADINSDNVQGFFFLSDGRVAAVLQEWPEDGSLSPEFSVAILTATPRDQLPEKTTLVYASLYLNYDARNKIIAFNKTSDKYRIEVRDYSEYVTNDNAGSAALQKLNTEILAGSVPDILDTSSLPIQQYAAKGVLEDLWPFIDNDPDLGRDALMIRPLEANQLDGKLYEIFSTFSVYTAIGPARIVGDRTSWTLAELLEALEKMPEGCSIFGQTDTRDGMLSTVLAQNMDQFVNWDTGECSFDSDQFKALLSFCGSFPAEFDWANVDWDSWEEEESRIISGKQMLLSYSISRLSWTLQRIAAVFSDGYTYIGFPKEDGTCGSAFSTGLGVAMSSTCADKEGAWSFIRQTLLPQTKEDQYYYGSFPINKYDFDKMVAQALEPQYETDENGDPLLDEDGQPVLMDPGTMWISADTEIPLRYIEQADVDKFMALYNDITAIYRYDEKIYNAVQEVAGQYFAGDKPLDEAAALIQSKVRLYVNESR